jgi:hypothetical protein
MAGMTAQARTTSTATTVGMVTLPDRRVSIRVLLADDQAMIRSGLQIILEGQPGMDVVAEAADGTYGALRAGAVGFVLNPVIQKLTSRGQPAQAAGRPGAIGRPDGCAAFWTYR